MSGSFIITAVGEPKLSKRSKKLYIRCKTHKGFDISFFGKEHIALVQKQETPFRVTCVCKSTNDDAFKSTGVTLWVNQNYKLYFSKVRK